MAVIKDLGAVTAYASAVEGGYTGTKEEFETLMASYATVAEEAAESAESAQASATTASSAASTATTKASEATTAAQTATAKAEETQADADAAALDASQALSAASTATSKASEAAQSASDAATAKAAAQTAQTAAEGSATTAQTAAQTATQKAAEAAESARTLTIDPTLSKSGQAADAKKTGDAITGLKTDLNAVSAELSLPTSNNIIAFKRLTEMKINGVTVNTIGDAVFNFSGTCNNSGGRMIPVSDTFHINAGQYTLSMYTNLPSLIVCLCDAVTKEIKQHSSSDFPSLIRNYTDGDYYLAFNLQSNVSYIGDVKVSLLSGAHTSPPFEHPITANDVEARKQASVNSTAIDEINNKISVAIDEINNKISVLEVSKSVEFEQGTVKSDGELGDNANRIRTKEVFPSNFITATVDSNHRIWAAQYDINGVFLRINTSDFREWTPSLLGENTEFVRFVIVNNDRTPIVPTDETGFSLLYGFREDVDNEINEKISEVNDDISAINDRITKNKYYSSFKSYDFILDMASANSDATIVGDNYVVFGSGDDELTTSGGLIVNKYANGFENDRTDAKQLYHRFGHCNSVDYSPVNDCLIMGNGSGSYTLDGKIYIIPDFSDIVENDIVHTTSDNPLTLSNTNAIVIDCSSYDLGTKFNVIWGELNNKRQDIAYLITAKYGSSTSAADGGDNGTIRRILLGTGTNQLDYGSYSQAEDGEFNGTFNILDTYTQDGTAYAQCNQGCCYYNGKIYSAIGHDGLWMWEMRLDSDGNKIWYDEYKQKEYNADGSVLVHNSTSVCKSDKYIFFGQASVGVLAIPI